MKPVAKALFWDASMEGFDHVGADDFEQVDYIMAEDTVLRDLRHLGIDGSWPFCLGDAA